MAKQDIQQAVSKAKQHYQKGEIKQALRILEPYKDNEKVQSIIAGIKRRTQEVHKVKNKKRPSNTLTYVLVSATVVIIIVAFLVLAPLSNSTPAPQNDNGNESLPIASPTTTIYYAKNNNSYLRNCEHFDCPILEILDFGAAIEVVNSVSGDGNGGITTWYEAKRGGYIHALDVLENPPPTTAPPAPYGGSYSSSSSNSSSGSSSSSSNSSSSSSGNQSYACNCSKTCGSMSCQEAQYQLNACGCTARDGNHDGIACNAQCG